MSDVKYLKVPLKELFKSKRGNSKYTKKYCNENLGDYEVYTGTNYGSFSKINTFEFNTEQLTYTTDGVGAGTVNILRGKYNVGGHRAILSPIVESLHLDYFENILEPIFKSNLKLGNVPSITWNIIKNILIPVPINDSKGFCIENQKKLANGYMTIKSHKKKLKDKTKFLNDSYISVVSDKYKYKSFPLNQIFKYKRGGSCTKSYCHKNRGSFPVYSANNEIPLSYINSYEYDGRFITISRNGIAGKMTIFEEKFTINEDRFILLPLIKDLDLDYVKYTVEPIIRSYRKGRSGHDGQNEFTKLSFTILDTIEISLPIDEKGNICMISQNEISNKYKKIEYIKNSICEKIEMLSKIEIIQR